MTRKDLEAALAECVGHTPEGWVDDLGDIRESAEGPIIATVWNHVTPKRTNADAALIRLAPALASALREAWDTIDTRDKEIAALRLRAKCVINPSLDAALNEGDGSYKP